MEEGIEIEEDKDEPAIGRWRAITGISRNCRLTRTTWKSAIIVLDSSQPNWNSMPSGVSGWESAGS